MPNICIRLGTRASALARWQADWVAAQLQQRGVEVQLVPITTEGDVKTGPLGEIGGQGLFTKRIQQSLLDDEIDLAVHSLKDLPTASVAGLALTAVPKRERNGDALVSNTAAGVGELPQAARVGTGSMRRRTQLLHVRPDLNIREIRGNVDTRLRKLDEGQFDAIILAEAGLVRLGFTDRIKQIIPQSLMLPAIGQGALGLETRQDDEATIRVIQQLDDSASHQAVLAERTLLATLRGGCLAPVGACAQLKDDLLHLEAVVLSVDGSTRITAADTASRSQAVPLGKSVADQLLEQGAGDLISASRQ